MSIAAVDWALAIVEAIELVSIPMLVIALSWPLTLLKILPLLTDAIKLSKLGNVAAAALACALALAIAEFADDNTPGNVGNAGIAIVGSVIVGIVIVGIVGNVMFNCPRQRTQ